MAINAPASCPHCGHTLADVPVDAGAQGETGFAEMVCPGCSEVIRWQEDGPTRPPDGP